MQIIRARLFIVLCFVAQTICSARSFYTVNLDSVLDVLDLEISVRQSNGYNNKERHIAAIRDRLRYNVSGDDDFNALILLYDEFRQYQSDSALYYSRLLEDLAELSGDDVKIAVAKSKHFDYFLSIWQQDDAVAEYDRIDVNLLPEKDRMQFYKNSINLFFRLSIQDDADEAMKTYSAEMCKAYMDSVLTHSNPGTFEHEYYRLLKYDSEISAEDALELMLDLQSKYNFDDRGNALWYARLGAIARRLGDERLQTYYVALSSLCDIRSYNHETASIFTLSQLMNNQKDIDRAVRYMHVAFEDALFFNSRVKQSQLGNVLPMLENMRYESIKSQRKAMLWSIVFLSVFLSFTGVLLVKLMHRNKRLKKMKSMLDKVQEELVDANTALSALNGRLKDVVDERNTSLMELLYSNIGFLRQVETRSRDAVNNIKTKGVETVRFLPYQLGIKDEHKRIMEEFDRIFLQVFPTFIDDLNSLLKDGESVALDDGGGMTTELRIFALMRIGITETDAVAAFLNISPNSVYVYRARLKSKSDLTKSEFDIKIMEVKKAWL